MFQGGLRGFRNSIKWRESGRKKRQKFGGECLGKRESLERETSGRKTRSGFRHKG